MTAFSSKTVHGAALIDIERLTGHKFRKSKHARMMLNIARASAVPCSPCGTFMADMAPRERATNKYRRHDVILSGVIMGIDDTSEAINQEIEQLTRARVEFEKLANQINALTDVITPSLAQQIKDLRQMRMSVASEMQLTLTALRDVRDFFLESQYETEMERLERFVKVCREIEELKASGVFDAVVDSALRLAVSPNKEAA